MISFLTNLFIYFNFNSFAEVWLFLRAQVGSAKLPISNFIPVSCKIIYQSVFYLILYTLPFPDERHRLGWMNAKLHIVVFTHVAHWYTQSTRKRVRRVKETERGFIVRKRPRNSPVTIFSVQLWNASIVESTIFPFRCAYIFWHCDSLSRGYFLTNITVKTDYIIMVFLII